MRKGLVLVLSLATAVSARAREDAGQGGVQGDKQRAGPQAAAGEGEGGRGASDLFERACVDLLYGRTPRDEKEVKALKDACTHLISSKADARIEAAQREQGRALAAEQQRQQQREARVQAGVASGEVREGQGVLAAFERAGTELASPGRARMPGMGRSGPFKNTLITNPVGWFNGIGVNAELFRSFAAKFSWIAGLRYSNTDATNGNAETFGVLGGIDWFATGRNNEGLRMGPRVEFAVGREEFQGSTTFARLGLGAELGYNFIASNGITALLAVGLGGRVAGDSQNDDFASFVGGDFGPYGKVGLGYSW